MEPTWVLSAPDGPHVEPMNLVIRVVGRHIIYDAEKPRDTTAVMVGSW